MAKGTCPIIENGEVCGRLAHGRGLCGMHYHRWERHGDPEYKQPPPKRIRTNQNYVFVRVPPGHPVDRGDGKAREHRFVAYEAGLLTDLSDHVHHKDGNKKNNAIENLEVMTALEHNRAHKSWENGIAHNLAKTHCPQGHPYSGDNLYVPPSGGERLCRECRRQSAARARARKKSIT